MKIIPCLSHLMMSRIDHKEVQLYNENIQTADNEATDEFQRLAKISDDVIRYIVIREDEDKTRK